MPSAGSRCEARGAGGRWAGFATGGGKVSRVRVLHVIVSVDPRGGGPIEMVNATSEVWLRHGHVTHIATLDEPGALWVKDATLTVFALGDGGKSLASRLSRGYGYSARLAPWLRQHASDYDAVVVHGLWNYASLGVWRGLRGRATPYFAFTHGMLDPWFIVAYPLKARLKAVFWRVLERRVLRDAKGVLFTTEEERDLAGRSFKPYTARGLVVGLGARDVADDPDRSRHAFLAKLPAVEGRRFVLFLSRIHPKKGIDLLIRGFAEHAADHPSLDLVIAGPDQVGLQRDLERLASDLGIAGRIHWPGMLTGDAKAGAFRGAAFFALPSHQENFGIAIAEALAYGTPVLITNKVNIWREIEADGAGIVVTDDEAGVGEGLRRLAAMSDEVRTRMAIDARTCFQRRFELERMSMDLLALIAREAGVRADAVSPALPVGVAPP